MIIDLEDLKAKALAAKQQTGENYLSLNINISIHSDHVPSVSISSYTPISGHTEGHKTPEDSLRDTVQSTNDSEALLKEANRLEEQVRHLRFRAGKGVVA
jgi:hypothetical protein